MKTIYVKHLWRDTLKKVSVVRRINWEKTISAAMFLCAMFFLGREVAATLQGAREAAGSAVSSEVIQQETENWGLGFGKAGEKPVGNASISEMKQYDAYYMAEGEEKVLYLTFDCGYENGNTAPILDALKKHNAPATFFVVGHFLETAAWQRKAIRWEIIHIIIPTCPKYRTRHPFRRKWMLWQRYSKRLQGVNLPCITDRPRGNTVWTI